MQVTILILIDGFLQFESGTYRKGDLVVTILILIDGFLQLDPYSVVDIEETSHNPYFNRWFSAIVY